MNFKLLHKKDISMIKPLWQKLWEISAEDSQFYKNHFQSMTFEKRCQPLENIEDKNIRIEVIEREDKLSGYCISAIEDNIGEVFSLFVEEETRKSGYGTKLIQNSIQWLKKNNCQRIGLKVTEGHESVFNFYTKFGFYPPTFTYLELKD